MQEVDLVLLKQNSLLQCWNMVPLICVCVCLPNCTVFMKQELSHALQNESFSGCDIHHTETCQLISPTMEEEPDFILSYRRTR